MAKDKSKSPKESTETTDSSNKSNKKGFGGGKKNNILLSVLLGFAVVGMFMFIGNMFQTNEEPITQKVFLEELKKGKYKEVVITDKVTSSGLDVEFTYKDSKDGKKGKKGSTAVISSEKIKDEISEQTTKTDTKLTVTKPSNSGAVFQQLFFMIVPLLIIMYWFSRSMKNNMGFGANKNKKVEVKKISKVTFDDIAGKDEEKAELMDIINYYNNSEEYEKRNLRIPRGILLEGNPGTGKTLLAKGLAGEINASFFYMNGAEFNGMFRGSGTNAIKSLFDEAREKAPSIIFIDEIDAVGKKRMGGINDKDSEQTLNQLLTELDGFQELDAKVVLLGATNLADSLDPALLRSGRFDRKILVGLPNKKERSQILEHYIKKLNIAKDVDINSLGEQIQGFSGADIENLVNEANMCSYNSGREEINSDDFELAFNKVIVGLPKTSTVYNPEQKEIIANHESGHALVGALLDGAKKVKKVTIIPHGKSGGFAMMLPKSEMFVQTKDYLENTIVTLLSGRGAEEILSNTQTTGVYQDIKEATEIAKGMVANYGMTGSFQFKTEEDLKSTEMNNVIDSILNNAYETSKQIINDNIPRITLLSKVLQTKETLYEKEIDYIVTLDNEDINNNFESILQSILDRDFEKESKEEIEDNNEIVEQEETTDVETLEDDNSKTVIVNKEDTGNLIKEAIKSKQPVNNLD